MKFSVDPRIFEKFSGLHIGVIVAKGVDNTGGSAAPELAQALRAQEAAIRSRFKAEQLGEVPQIAAWRAAYVSFGAKPKEHRSSIENLCRLVLNGVQLRAISKLVDAYNGISLKHVMPVGGEDLDQMQGDLQLTFAGADEAPVLLLGDKEARPPHEGEVIYKDAHSTICRRFNWREAERTKLTELTRNCILVVEGLPPVSRAEVEAAVDELKAFIQTHCGGSLSTSILDAGRNEVGC